VILADAYQARLLYGPALSLHPLVSIGPRSAPGRLSLVLPTVVVGDQVLGDTIVVQAADIIRRQ
jgi:hypothetical protein